MLKNVGIVAAMSTMRGLGYSSIWIYSALYLRTVLGMSVFQDGLIITLGSSLAAVFQIYGGMLSDRFGYKRTVVASIAVATSLYLLLVCDGATRTSVILYPVVFVALMIFNAAQAPAVNAIVSQSSDMRLKGFSVLRIGANIGWGIGPAVGGFLISVTGFYYLFVFGFLSSLASLFLSFTIIDSKPSGKASVQFHAGNRLLIALAFSATLLYVVQAQETVTLSNYANILRGLNYSDLGIIYLTNGIAVIATQGFVYRIAKRMGNYYSYILGGFLYSFGFFSYSLFSGLGGMVAATLILTIGEDFVFPAGYSMVSLVSKPQNIGRNMGTYTAFISAGRAIGPLLGGFVLSFTSDPVEIWSLTTLSGFISVLMFVIIFAGKHSLWGEKGTETA